MRSTPDFNIHWYHSLQFRVSAIFLTIFFLIMVTIIAVVSAIGDHLIENQAYLKLSKAGDKVVSELNQRTTIAESIVTSMADIAKVIPSEDKRFSSLMLSLLDRAGSKHLIAGGGTWPEPYILNKNVERNSHFWGRDKQGKLNFYNDYNLPEGNGYHHEEWYVPAQHLGRNQRYWSKSYTDPYSLQPMVTVTAPLYENEKFLGATTVDLKLEGLQKLLHEATQEFGGYAFALDRNGRFLSFPDDKLARLSNPSSDEGSLLPYITMEELAKEFGTFESLARLLRIQNRSLNSPNGIETDTLATLLANDSYQIDLPEAKIIASLLSRPEFKTSQRANKLIEQDHFLNEAVFVTVTTMPKTAWQIVTVMPNSSARKDAKALFNQLLMATIFIVLIAIILVWALLRYHLTYPLFQLTQQLQEGLTDDHRSQQLIKTTDKGELGALTHWFNRKTEQLLESQFQIQKLAFFDPLTGLPNRRLLYDRLNQRLASAERQRCSGAVMFLDLDHFKHLNDSLGHSIGDELLIQVGNRLTECLRKEDTIARLGGDEFVVIVALPRLNQEQIYERARLVANKIIEALDVPFELNSNHFHITTSIGITFFNQVHFGAEELLKQADTAMYQAKSNGRHHYCFFEKDMQTKADERLRIEAELRYAISHNELNLVYQPQVNADGECESVETLLRWSHPKRGFISPNEFIPIAEESGLIIQLGHWVIEQACCQMKKWYHQGKSIRYIAVNVSPLQFNQANFVNDIKASIHRFQIKPEQLMLEITEGVIIDDTETAITKMHTLKELGVKISMDDFGTGYSSLTYLRLLPLDELKIDKSFINDITTDPNDAVIVGNIISMTHELGYTVIAEGVETLEQQQVLLRQGCKHYQGYYFSKPLNEEDLEKYLICETLTA
ncbi:EAL domain-containing protein [Neptuniibacter sp. QD57_21]|uniref:bifunctional diguanylate cyclase/phosphodiesterase n=1 Tax=Neptuniibacter sp. QD57_21 TaxID=3398213 RepID=UPI0039F48A5A